MATICSIHQSDKGALDHGRGHAKGSDTCVRHTISMEGRCAVMVLRNFYHGYAIQLQLMKKPIVKRDEGWRCWPIHHHDSHIYLRT